LQVIEKFRETGGVGELGPSTSTGSSC